MQIKIICTFWGSEHLGPEAFINKAMEAGYDGVEMNIAQDPGFVKSLQKSLEKHSAILVAQQWLPPVKESVEAYRKRMIPYLEHLSSLSPAFINSHTGKDYFSFQENCSLIETCMEISRRTGVGILHETHRGRFTHHAASLLPYLEAYPELQLNADLSHFCAVSESLLEDQEEILQPILEASHYIHARVGHDQGPQVSHPFAPEWSSNLERFLGFWQKIIDLASQRGERVFHICPEFGPAPYMPALPFTNKPVADQWQINVDMMHYLKENLKVS